jgi:hypothetical protein
LKAWQKVKAKMGKRHRSILNVKTQDDGAFCVCVGVPQGGAGTNCLRIPRLAVMQLLHERSVFHFVSY